MNISQESYPKSQEEIPVLLYTQNKNPGKRYLKKISVVGKQFSPKCLSPEEVSDLVSYLVLETSYYTNKQFKASKSFEAYNQMVSGFIASVQGKKLRARLLSWPRWDITANEQVQIILFCLFSFRNHYVV